MQLVEHGRIRLTDPVAQYIPSSRAYGKDDITIRHLLTHTSGLRPDLELEIQFHGADEAIRRAVEEKPTAAPGERFVYCDINFFLLGDIVRRVTGERLDALRAARIFQPLGMKDTTFLPPASWRRGSRRPRRATAGLAVRRPGVVDDSCAASCTIRRRGGWTASPDTPGCSAPPRTCRASAGCCSAAASLAARGFCRRRPSRG